MCGTRISGTAQNPGLIRAVHCDRTGSNCVIRAALLDHKKLGHADVIGDAFGLLKGGLACEGRKDLDQKGSIVRQKVEHNTGPRDHEYRS